MSGPDDTGRPAEAGTSSGHDSEHAGAPDDVRRPPEESDALLDAVERLKQAELEKREARFSSDEFGLRAREVEEQAREVFRLAAQDRMTEPAGDPPPDEPEAAGASPDDHPKPPTPGQAS